MKLSPGGAEDIIVDEAAVEKDGRRIKDAKVDGAEEISLRSLKTSLLYDKLKES